MRHSALKGINRIDWSATFVIPFQNSIHFDEIWVHLKYYIRKKFHKFHRKTPLGSLFNKVPDLLAYNFIKKRLQHRCFPKKFVKFLRTHFFYRAPLAGVSVHQKWLYSYPFIFDMLSKLNWYFYLPMKERLVLLTQDRFPYVHLL